MEKPLKNHLIKGQNKMLTLLVELIVGIFIANFKVSEHPYFSNLITGILIGIASFIFGNIIFLYENNFFIPINKQIQIFLITQGIGFICFIILSILAFFKRIDS